MATTRETSIHDLRYQRLIGGLAKCRKESGVSQQTLAAKIGVSQSDISKIEACERRIDLLETLDWLSACHRMPVSEAVKVLTQECYDTDKYCRVAELNG